MAALVAFGEPGGGGAPSHGQVCNVGVRVAGVRVCHGGGVAPS